MRVLVPLPDHDFDITEVAVPWKLLTRAAHTVVFATEHGAVPACDPVLMKGVVFGQLGAKPEPKAFYAEMAASPEFRAPLRWDAIDPEAFDGLWLCGGHAQGMKQYLGSEALQSKVASFFALGRPVAAICHGVLVAARARASDGHSPLFGKKSTCLPKYMERTAFYVTAWRRGRYYRTYPAYVEDEVRAALASPADFVRGPVTLTRYGTDADDRGAFVCEDATKGHHYLSARWPGDAYLLAKKFMARLG